MTKSFGWNAFGGSVMGFRQTWKVDLRVVVVLDNDAIQKKIDKKKGEQFQYYVVNMKSWFSGGGGVWWWSNSNNC